MTNEMPFEADPLSTAHSDISTDFLDGIDIDVVTPELISESHFSIGNVEDPALDAYCRQFSGFVISLFSSH
jgi:hypothetical protein